MTTAGSTGVYLSVRARMPGTSREAIDRAAMDAIDIVEVPGPHARPPVLVPRDDMAVALRLHHASYARHAAAYFRSAGYSEAAFKALVAQVCRALDEGPLSTSDIRAAVSHPDAGELLVGALVDLSVRGVIRRYAADGRLDSSKYVYELRHPDDRPDLDAEGDDAAAVAKAARLFLRRYGPAAVDEIADWGQLTKGAVRKALTTLEAEHTPIEGWAKDVWLLPNDVRAWKAFSPDGDRVAFLPYRDPFVWIRRPPAVLARRDTAPILNSDSKQVAIRDVHALHHHVIVAGGSMVGVWEYDVKTRRVVTRLWQADKALGTRVANAAVDTERFIRQQLGDASLSAVDPDARRAARLAFCRR